MKYFWNVFVNKNNFLMTCMSSSSLNVIILIAASGVSFPWNIIFILLDHEQNRCSAQKGRFLDCDWTKGSTSAPELMVHVLAMSHTQALVCSKQVLMETDSLTHQESFCDCSCNLEMNENLKSTRQGHRILSSNCSDLLWNNNWVIVTPSDLQVQFRNRNSSSSFHFCVFSVFELLP